MPRFDVYRNPNHRASHALFLDVQSDLVSTSTRWCVPLYAKPQPHQPLLTGAQVRLDLNGEPWVLDAPNILAVPANLLRHAHGQLTPDDRLRVEAALDFMLRGY